RPHGPAEGGDAAGLAAGARRVARADAAAVAGGVDDAGDGAARGAARRRAVRARRRGGGGGHRRRAAGAAAVRVAAVPAVRGRAAVPRLDRPAARWRRRRSDGPAPDLLRRLRAGARGLAVAGGAGGRPGGDAVLVDRRA